MKINTKPKIAEPWAATLSTLAKLEQTIAEGESDAMEARWKFGRELLSRRTEYKGRMVVPADLMKLATEKIGRSKWEVKTRIRFAERYPTKQLMGDAVSHYPSWRQMVTVGLVTKTRQPRKSSKGTHAGAFLIRRLTKEIDRAFTIHSQLTREQVADIEALAAKCKALLDQVDRNDSNKLSAVG